MNERQRVPSACAALEVLLGTPNDNSVQLSLDANADVEVGDGRNTRSYTTHLEELDCATIPKETVEFPLSAVARHHLSLLSSRLIHSVVIAGEAVLCLHADCVADHDEPEASKQNHVSEQDRNGDLEGYVLAVDGGETSLDGAHRGAAVLEDVVDAGVVGRDEVSHLECKALEQLS